MAVVPSRDGANVTNGTCLLPLLSVVKDGQHDC